MSTLKANTIQSTSGGAVTLTNQIAVKSFTTFSGDGTTVRSSFNLSSMADHNTGRTNHNFTNNMSDTHYTVSSSASYVDNTNDYETYLSIWRAGNVSATRTTSQNNVGFWETAYADPGNDACCSVIGDLA